MKALLLALLLALPLSALAAKPAPPDPLGALCVQSFENWWTQQPTGDKWLVLCNYIDEIRVQVSGTPTTVTTVNFALIDDAVVHDRVELTKVLIINGEVNVHEFTYPEPLPVGEWITPLILVSPPPLLGTLPREYPIVYQVQIRGRY